MNHIVVAIDIFILVATAIITFVVARFILVILAGRRPQPMPIRFEVEGDTHHAVCNICHRDGEGRRLVNLYMRGRGEFESGGPWRLVGTYPFCEECVAAYARSHDPEWTFLGGPVSHEANQ